MKHQQPWIFLEKKRKKDCLIEINLIIVKAIKTNKLDDDDDFFT
jgi:hypothetical protein